MTTTPKQSSAGPLPVENGALQARSRFTLIAGGRKRTRGVVTVLVALFLVLVVAVLFVARFSFRQSAVVQDLEEATGAKLQVQHFRQTYFPHPGCVLEGLSFVPGRAPKARPAMTIQRLTIVGSYLRSFAHHVSLIRAYGMHVVFPPLGSDVFSARKKSKTVVEQFLTDNAVLEFTPHDPDKPPLRFLLHHFVIYELASGRPLRFESTLSNPQPPGR